MAAYNAEFTVPAASEGTAFVPWLNESLDDTLKGKIPSIIEENLPITGHVFKGNGEYRDTCGSYLFEGRDTNSIKTAIQTTIQKFHINTISINQGEKICF